MKHASEHTKALKKLMAKLGEKVKTPAAPARSPLEQIVHSFLAWDASLTQADNAYSRLMKHVVDLNDLRVSAPDELVEVLGTRYPMAQERIHRLRAVLNVVYHKSHAMELPKLEKLSKRDAHAYLDKFDGMVPFVSASVCLLSLQGHAVPVDDMLLKRLRDDGVVERQAPLAEVQSFLEHHILAEDGIAAFYRLRAYAEGDVKFPAAKTTRKSRK